ncbi:MAG: hypothetical protein ACI89L_001747 [Phycisphaerales bacterium]|jgi:hypothetical protein
MNRFLITLCLGSLALPALGQAFTDDFEGYDTGQLPGSPWVDVNTRIDNPTVASPSARVVNTTGPDGEPTRAVRTAREFGTSSGILREINPAESHSLTMDVRIDRFTDAPGINWPGGIGFLQDLGAEDLNQDPQAILYAYSDQRWHLFIKNGGANGTGIDLLLNATPTIQLAKWYTLQVDANTETGAFSATVYDATTNQRLGGVNHTFADWDPAVGQFDAIAAFDGDANGGGNFPGRSTFDNVKYIPAPGPASLFLLSGLALGARRRR